MTSPDLIRCRIRLDRTKEQVNDLTSAILDWGKTNPCKIIVKEEGGVRNYFAECHAPPERLDAIVSEILHHFRATLDNLACRLAERNGKSTSGVYFPFAQTRQFFNEPTVQKKVRKLSDADRDYILSLKPYGSDDGDRILYKIHDLDRDDKHIDLIPIGAVTALAGLNMRVKQGAGGGYIRSVRGYKGGWTKIAQPVLILSFDADPEIDPGLQVAINVTLGDVANASGEPVITTLEAMHQKTSDIIAHFDVG